MMKIEISDDILAAFDGTPEELVSEMRLAAAIHWYSRGAISQGKAAQIAGLGRDEFLQALARERSAEITVCSDKLKRELEFSMRASLALLGQ